MISSSRIITLIVASIVVTVAGCVSLETALPPPGRWVTQVLPEVDPDLPALERGRSLVIQHCGRCHAVEPIARYSLQQWRKIVPDMAAESYLNAAQTQEVLAYILTTRDALDRGGKPQADTR
ncbi:MAG: hypothetical protein GC164_15280 [Phycisphaera sp.]|nr:hypothetical protein [Phycisphaera sp.]